MFRRAPAALGFAIVCLSSLHAAPFADESAPAPASRSRASAAAVLVSNHSSSALEAPFISVGGSQRVFFTRHDARILDPVRKHSVWLVFVNGEAQAIDGTRAASTKVTFFNGGATAANADGLASNAASEPAFDELAYRRVWPGVDVRLQSLPLGLEYTFEVAPLRDPRVIKLRYEGVSKVALDADGNAILTTPFGEMTDAAPVAYQDRAGQRFPVAARFVVDGNELSFALGDYDSRYPLIVDPTLVYSTYLGGSGFDQGRAIAVDAAGNAYVAGRTQSFDLPATPGSYDPSWNGGTGDQPSDAFVAKINNDGTHFDYLTFLGGSGNDEALGIAVNGAGQAFVTGFTESADFRTSPFAFQSAIGSGHHDGFLTRLNAAGDALIYSTFLGANASTDGVSVALDATGQRAIIAGNTLATNLTTTPGAIGPAHASTGKADGFVLKFNADGNQVIYGSYLGGTDREMVTGLAVRGDRAFVTGFTLSLDLVTSPSAAQPNPPGATFISSDGGKVWQYGNGGARSHHVLATAIDPIFPSTVYEGTEDIGLLKSTDGGLTWVVSGTGMTGSPVVSDIAVDPVASSRLLAATSSGLYRSLDAAGSWTMVAGPMTRVVFAASNSSIAYAVNSTGAFKSADAGATWTKVLDAAGQSLAIDSTNALVAYIGTTDAKVFRTTDGGVTWTMSSLSSQGFVPAVVGLVVDPLTPTVVYAGLRNSSIVRSTDSGASFSYYGAVFLSNPTRLVVDAADPHSLYFGGEYGMSFTHDNGTSWEFHSIEGNSLTIDGLSVHDGTIVAGIFAQSDGFVYQIDTASTADGLVYGTYLGAAGADGGRSVAVDSQGRAVVVATASYGFPATVPNGSMRIHALVRLSTNGSRLELSSRIGPPGSYVIANSVALAPDGAAYVTGVFDDDDPRVFIDRIEADGLQTSEYFLDSMWSDAGYPAWDEGKGIAVDGNGDVYVTGVSGGTNYPTTAGVAQPSSGGSSDAIVSKVRFADVAGSNQDLARGRPVVASSSFSPEYAAAYAVDGDALTRWSSNFTDDEWIYVDLGARYRIDHLVLRWETAYGSEYVIQVSDDAATWTEIAHHFGSGGTETITDMHGSGRYVRLLGMQRGTPWGYSLWSFEVYGTPEATPPSANLALNRPSSASSAFSADYQSSLAFDGRTDTRFSSAFTDNEWIQVDLGRVANVSQVVLLWETAFGAEYEIQVKKALGDAWQTIAHVADGDGGTDDLIGLSGEGRYVRMLGLRRGTPWGYSLWEFEVYEGGAASQ